MASTATGPDTAIDDADRTFARGQAGYFAHFLLGLSLAGGGQVRRGAVWPSIWISILPAPDSFGAMTVTPLPVKGQLQISPGVVADGQVVVEIAGAQIAAANPSDGHCARIVVVDPALVVRDPQHAAPSTPELDW